MIPEVLEEFMRANIAGRPKTPQTANRPSKNRGRYYDSDSDVPPERYELSSDDDELYAPAPVKRSKQHADDRRRGPNTQASAREQNAKRSSHPKGAYSPSQRNQGQRQRSPSEPVELILSSPGTHDGEMYQRMGMRQSHFATGLSNFTTVAKSLSRFPSTRENAILQDTQCCQSQVVE
jgi:hypothetical protein